MSNSLRLVDLERPFQLPDLRQPGSHVRFSPIDVARSEVQTSFSMRTHKSVFTIINEIHGENEQLRDEMRALSQKVNEQKAEINRLNATIKGLVARKRHHLTIRTVAAPTSRPPSPYPLARKK